MSRYAADLDRLATRLARMATDPAAVAGATDMAVVNRARLAVRLWCRTVLTDVAPAAQAHVPADPGLHDVARYPVGALLRLLERDPELWQPAQRLTATSLAAGRDANEHWRSLLEAVEVAAHEWSSSDPATRPIGEAAWATVADVAAVAEAAALVDRDLRADQPGTRTPGQARDGWEIALAAEQVRRVADSGPLLAAPPLRPAPDRLRPVLVRSLRELGPAQNNLAILVTTGRHLSPALVGALAATHSRTVRTLAAEFAATSPPPQRAVRQQLATALGNHADMLGQIRVAIRPLQSIDADDPRPGLQMSEIRTGLRRLSAQPGRAPFRDDQPSLLAAVTASLAFGPAVAASVHGHIRAGRWLQPTDCGRRRWKRVSPDAPIAEAAMLVQGHARTLSWQLPNARPVGSAHRSPNEILTPQLLRRDRRRGLSPAMSQPTDLSVEQT